MHLVGFIIRNLSRCTVTWTSNSVWLVTLILVNSNMQIFLSFFTNCAWSEKFIARKYHRSSMPFATFTERNVLDRVLGVLIVTQLEH